MMRGNSSGDLKIKAASLHTDGMLADEIRSCLGASDLKLTVGALMSLALLRSPYVRGGGVSDGDLRRAMELVPHGGKMPPREFHDALLRELATAWRAWELIEPDGRTDSGKRSEIGLFSPEWLADLLVSVCGAAGATWREALWEMPAALVFHLQLARARQHGAITSRPKGIKEALAKLKQLKQQEQQDNG